MDIRDAGAHFQRMMNAHFNDCGLLFGTMWHGFGIGSLIPDTQHEFMRNMLLTMFLNYHARPSLPLPPLSEVVTVDPGQRVCAQCLTFMLGHGKMMRCSCHQVLSPVDPC